MSSVFHVIEEEFERLNEAKQAYEAAIKREEQGAPQIKHGGGHKDYLYLARRSGHKVLYRYIGHAEMKIPVKYLTLSRYDVSTSSCSRG